MRQTLEERMWGSHHGRNYRLKHRVEGLRKGEEKSPSCCHNLPPLGTPRHLPQAQAAHWCCTHPDGSYTEAVAAFRLP